MMRRLISLILIPLVVVSQSFALMAHAHSGYGADFDGTEAAHFHLTLDAAHTHHHDHAHGATRHSASAHGASGHNTSEHGTLVHTEGEHESSGVPAWGAPIPHDDDSVYVAATDANLISRIAGAIEYSMAFLAIPQRFSSLVEITDGTMQAKWSCGSSLPKCAHKFGALDSLSLRV